MDIEKPAVEQRSASLEPATGKVGSHGAGSRGRPPLATGLVTEQQVVLAQQPDRLQRPVAVKFLDKRDRLPVLTQQSAARRSWADPADPVVLFGAEHGRFGR